MKSFLILIVIAFSLGSPKAQADNMVNMTEKARELALNWTKKAINAMNISIRGTQDKLFKKFDRVQKRIYKKVKHNIKKSKIVVSPAGKKDSFGCIFTGEKTIDFDSSMNESRPEIASLIQGSPPKKGEIYICDFHRSQVKKILKKYPRSMAIKYLAQTMIHDSLKMTGVRNDCSAAAHANYITIYGHGHPIFSNYGRYCGGESFKSSAKNQPLLKSSNKEIRNIESIDNSHRGFNPDVTTQDP